MLKKSPEELIDYYESKLRKHGDTALGAAWPNEHDRTTRYEVMQGLWAHHQGSFSLCDLACGTGGFLEFLMQSGNEPGEYLGVDMSSAALEKAMRKFPEHDFVKSDFLDQENATITDQQFDFVVANGLFTVKSCLDQEKMWTFLKTMLHQMWVRSKQGMAFNVMSAVVDWTRDDLFHVKMDKLAALLYEFAGRNVVFRSDYGLYEYTAYVYRDARRNGMPNLRKY